MTKEEILALGTHSVQLEPHIALFENEAIKEAFAGEEGAEKVEEKVLKPGEPKPENRLPGLKDSELEELDVFTARYEKIRR
jgi:hypothetical protein